MLARQSCVANGQWLVAAAQLQPPDQQPASQSASALANLPTLPPAPQGMSTILGGDIRSVDPVRDEITLKVFGQRPVKILFDERTHVFRDRSRIPLRELGRSDQASVQALLAYDAVSQGARMPCDPVIHPGLDDEFICAIGGARVHRSKACMNSCRATRP